MSLVAYGASDESDSEDERTESLDNDKEVASSAKVSRDLSPVLNGDYENVVTKDELLNDSSSSSLKLTTTLLENSLKILDRNRSQPIRITIPSLEEVRNKTEDTTGKKKKVTTTGSGLLSLLAPPKNVVGGKSVPNKVVKNDISSKPKKANNSLVPRSVVKKEAAKVKKDQEEEEDDWDPGKSFFFCSKEDEPVEYHPIEAELCVEPKPTVGSDLEELNRYIPPDNVVSGPSLPSSEIHTESQTLQVNEEALEKLCGRSGRKRGAAEIQDQIIDVHADALVGEANLWLTKDLTMDKPVSAKKNKNLSTVERRKHQITYLASQAKEKEMELRNQWANNRMTKKQTQAKYGF